ncbi:MAG: TolC family protein [Bacteroidetes bacterium]|nr:TolC family protein [Bacteroidota bacterium]
MRNHRNILLLFVFLGFNLAAQNKLTLQQAITVAMQQNYDINIAKVSANISATANSYGNAGFLPSVNFLAATSRSSYNTIQEFSTGALVNRKNALTQNLNSGVALSWTVFDGMKMFATKDKLEALEAQGQTFLKMEIETMVSKVISLYFDVVRQQQLIKASNETMKIYLEREKIAQRKLEIGSGSKLDLLQAIVDRNAQKSILLRLNISMETALVSLNQMLTKSSTDTYTVEDSIVFDDKLVLSTMKQNAAAHNQELQYAKRNIDIANYSLRELQSASLPQFGVNLNYNFTQTKNQVGLVLSNQNLGLNAGVNASWNLFNGYKSRTQIKIARFGIELNNLTYQRAVTGVDASMQKSWRSYQNTIEILKLEEENIAVAKENATIALERFRLGTSNTIELMLAQKSYEDALTRLVSARYDAKLSEIELLRLQGTLIK